MNLPATTEVCSSTTRTHGFGILHRSTPLETNATTNDLQIIKAKKYIEKVNENSFLLPKLLTDTEKREHNLRQQPTNHNHTAVNPIPIRADPIQNQPLRPRSQKTTTNLSTKSSKKIPKKKLAHWGLRQRRASAGLQIGRRRVGVRGRSDPCAGGEEG